MKTKKIIYVSIYSILILISLVTGNYIPALLFLLLMASDFTIINLKEEIKKGKEQFDKQLKERYKAYDELHNHSLELVKMVESEREKNKELSEKSAKHDAYLAKERKRSREKYNRLYKKDLSVKEFAEKYAGKEVSFVDSCGIEGVNEGYIAGYSTDNRIIIGVEIGWKSLGDGDVIIAPYDYYVYSQIKSIKLI